MNRYSIFIIIFLISSIGLFFLFVGNRKEINNTSNVFLKTEDGSPIRLIKEEGFITWKKEGDKEYVRVENDEITIPNNSYVKTGDGRGYVIFPDDSSISLSSNTEILISYTPKHVFIIQLLGTTYHRVMSLGEGVSYEVQTTGTLAAVRGTKFAVMYDEKNKKTNVVVTEHVVDVSVRNETTTESNQKARKVLQGEIVTVKEEEVGVVSPHVESLSKTSTTSDRQIQPKAREFRMYVDLEKEKATIKSWLDENKKIDAVFDLKHNKDSFIKDIAHEVRVEMVKEEGVGTATRVSDSDEKKETIRMRSIDRALDTLKNRKEISQETESPSRGASKESQDGTSIQPKGIVTEPVSEKPVVTSVPVTRIIEAPILKEYNPNKEELSPTEQQFIDNFYTAYELYLYVDDKGEVCRNINGLSAKDILSRLETITSKAGYTLDHKEEILSLAGSIIAACEDGSLLKNMDAFQTKFDVIYPYSG